MPSVKMKTHKGTKKRFKVTSTGKVMHKRCGSSHLNSHKSGKRIRKLRKQPVLELNSVSQKIRRAMQRKEAGLGRFAQARAEAERRQQLAAEAEAEAGAESE